MCCTAEGQLTDCKYTILIGLCYYAELLNPPRGNRENGRMFSSTYHSFVFEKCCNISQNFGNFLT